MSKYRPKHVIGEIVTNFCSTCSAAIDFKWAGKSGGPQRCCACKEKTKLVNIRRWQRSNPDKRYLHGLIAHYGLNKQQYFDMLAAQENACAVCRRTAPLHVPTRRFLQVDHDHRTGKVRALLCNRCNSTIARVDESAVLLQQLIDYLERHK